MKPEKEQRDGFSRIKDMEMQDSDPKEREVSAAVAAAALDRQELEDSEIPMSQPVQSRQKQTYFPAARRRKRLPPGSRPDGFRNRLDRDWIHDFDIALRIRRHSAEATEHTESGGRGQKISRLRQSEEDDEGLEHQPESGLKEEEVDDSRSKLLLESASSLRSKSSRPKAFRPKRSRSKSIGPRAKRIKRRQNNVYDAVAGLVTSRYRQNPQISDSPKLPSRSVPYSPSEVLFRRRDAPERYLDHDIYNANERNLIDGGRDILPGSDLLKAIHQYVSLFYASHRPSKKQHGKLDMRSLDGTALLAFGILIEELVRDFLGRRGHLVFTKGLQLKQVGVMDNHEPKLEEAYVGLVGPNTFKELFQELERERQKELKAEMKIKKDAEEAAEKLRVFRASMIRPQDRGPRTSRLQRELLSALTMRDIDVASDTGSRDFRYQGRIETASREISPRINTSPERKPEETAETSSKPRKKHASSGEAGSSKKSRKDGTSAKKPTKKSKDKIRKKTKAAAPAE